MTEAKRKHRTERINALERERRHAELEWSSLYYRPHALKPPELRRMRELREKQTYLNAMIVYAIIDE